MTADVTSPQSIANDGDLSTRLTRRHWCIIVNMKWSHAVPLETVVEVYHTLRVDILTHIWGHDKRTDPIAKQGQDIRRARGVNSLSTKNSEQATHAFKS